MDFQDLDCLFGEGLKINLDQHQLDQISLTILNAALISRVGVQSVTASDVERVQHIHDAIKDTKMLSEMQRTMTSTKAHQEDFNEMV